MTQLDTIDITELAGVTGGIREGGCVIPDPMITQWLESKKMPLPERPPRKVPMPKGNPMDLSNIGTTQPK